MKTQVRAILDEVARYSGVSVGRMVGRRRTMEVVNARWTAMMLLLELTDLSHADIGSVFRRHHSTVTHAAVAVADLIAIGQGRAIEDGIRIVRDRLQGAPGLPAAGVDSAAIAELKELLNSLATWIDRNGLVVS